MDAIDFQKHLKAVNNRIEGKDKKKTKKKLNQLFQIKKSKPKNK